MEMVRIWTRGDNDPEVLQAAKLDAKDVVGVGHGQGVPLCS